METIPNLHNLSWILKIGTFYTNRRFEYITLLTHVFLLKPFPSLFESFQQRWSMDICTKRYQPFLLDVRNCCLFFHKVINVSLLKETFRSQIHLLSCCKPIFCTIFFSIPPENIWKPLFLTFFQGVPYKHNKCIPPWNDVETVISTWNTHGVFAGYRERPLVWNGLIHIWY